MQIAVQRPGMGGQVHGRGRCMGAFLPCLALLALPTCTGQCMHACLCAHGGSRGSTSGSSWQRKCSDRDGCASGSRWLADPWACPCSGACPPGPQALVAEEVEHSAGVPPRTPPNCGCVIS